MSAYSPPTRRIPSCLFDYPQCEAEAHTLFPLPSHQIKTRNLSFLKRHRQIFLFPRLKKANSSPFCAKTDENFVRFCCRPPPGGVDRNTYCQQWNITRRKCRPPPGGVDRNSARACSTHIFPGRPPPGGVDRNSNRSGRNTAPVRRRPPPGGVDRNS